ncbi:protein FAM169B [Cyprinodon tularosa]|uniref:protein FAM169B n=1 Tax=Cyprinodon tularosa TaxID=77115 RepID=UPI0018E20466|nr:protein FAM169B [Cyprinodon tularosa]XP_038130377.1 protein FAM169B [Cyprinodon tularosa]XP_038130378.1 protein FAM169B [Cyprinodon tularosa]
MYPVDLPPVDETELTSASENYLTSLKGTPSNNEWSGSQRVAITPSNISQFQLFEDDHPACTVLALHPPNDQTLVLALYLHKQWWGLDDVLRTSTSRSGLQSVQTIMERLIIFLLSRVVERPPSHGEVLFSLHPRTENCKVLWKDNQAVGFYTVKHKGSLCDHWSSRCYLLPVLDTALVRKSCRRRGFGLQMLHDFCSSFSSEDFLGVSSPLSSSMVAVIGRFLQQHEEHRERLYEVEAPGGWTQRRNIWLNIQLGRYTPEQTGGASLISVSSCNLNAPQITASFQLCDVKQCERSLSREILRTGCCSAANTHVLDLKAPSRPHIVGERLKLKNASSNKTNRNKRSKGARRTLRKKHKLSSEMTCSYPLRVK